ncbi:MAG: hypothetical protein U0271_12400 [Polyangiaceae bacterium]
MASSALVCGLLLASAACSHDWDKLEPSGGAPSTGGAGAGPTTGGQGGQGGQPAQGGQAQGGAGGSGQEVTYEAVVAACLDPGEIDPNPAACESLAGGDRFVVDTSIQGQNSPRYGYVRFDLDGALAGKTVDAATLQLFVPTIQLSEADQSGSIWQVAPFDLASLDVEVPNTVGAVLVPDQGAVSQGETVTFSLPPSVVSANASLYLAILPTTSDGVFYSNLNGANPPSLVVSYH